MEHIALYRKYRPSIFEEVASQNHVTGTLINQINSNRISHAYLFNGPRGTGKTTCAKILSRLVNCLNPNGHNPCNECENCKAILQDSFLDVIEMDAASHNGVDDIRELIDGVRYPPSVGKMKVVIIDEAHMITKGAFNALLKTIEEPPSYMIFIFATTEPNKIPQTIISRCQRFDFKRIEADEMQVHLKKIAKKENINIDDDALLKISKQASGAMRDALGILEKTASAELENINETNLDDILGTGFEDTQKLLEALINSNVYDALNISTDLYYSGKDISLVKEELIELLRKAMLYSAGLPNKISEVKAKEEAFFEKIGAKNKHPFFMFAIGEFIETVKNKSFLNARAEFEYTLAKICASSNSNSTSHVILNKDSNAKLKAEKPELKQKNVAADTIKTAEITEVKPEVEKLEEVKPVAAKEEQPKKTAPKPNENDFIINGIGWQEVLASVKQKNPYAYTVICKLNPISCDNGVFKASFPSNLKALSMGFESRGLSDILIESIKEICKVDVNISIV